MAVLLLAAFLALPFLAATSYMENGFVYPSNSKDFPYQFSNVSFDGNKTLTLPTGHSDLIGFFVIPINESDFPHEIKLIPNNSTTYTRDSEHQQILTLYNDSQSSFFWRTENGTTELRGFVTPFGTLIEKLDKDKIKIQFYTNGTIIYNDEHIVDVPLLCNFTHENYFYIPFNISWNHEFVSFTLKMGDGIKLAFFEGQFVNPPSMMEWPLLPLTTSTSVAAPTSTRSPTSTSTSTPTTNIFPKITSNSSNSESEFDFLIFVQQNYDLLIIIAIICALIMLCLMFSIFLCCCFKKSN